MKASFTVVVGAMLLGALHYPVSQASDLLSYGEWTASMANKNSNFQSTTMTRYARWGVGNGGDSLRLNMAKARTFAANMVTKVTDKALQRTDGDIREFLSAHRDALAGDIMASPYVWDEEPRSTCAWTTMPEGDRPAPQTIAFSYPTCRESILSFVDASVLLIHESAHHFHKDEDFADRLALTIVNIWQSGAMQWQDLPLQNAPSPRMGHASVFDPVSDSVVVFGGVDDNGRSLNTGAKYNLVTDSWTPMSSSNAPARYQPILVAVGKKLLVWGGFYSQNNSGVDWQHSGAIYDSATDTWTQLMAPYSEAKSWHIDDTPVQKGVVLGDKVFIWGGVTKDNKSIGAIWDMNKEQWLPISSKNAPKILGGHTLVAVDGPSAFSWEQKQLSGLGMIVYGGYEGKDLRDRAVTSGGSYYHLESDTWHSLSEEAVPGARSNHEAVWTGESMVVFSGAPSRTGAANKVLHATGGIYDLKSDTWTGFTTQIGVERTGHTMVWSGKEVLIMGGKSRSMKTFYSDVLGFDPENQSWRSVSGQKAPSIRWMHSAVWTGSSMVVFGGGLGYYTEPEANGGVFYP